MHTLKVETPLLKQAIDAVLPFTDQKRVGTLACIRLSTKRGNDGMLLVLTTTDMDYSAEVEIPCNGELPDAIIVSGNGLKAIVGCINTDVIAVLVDAHTQTLTVGDNAISLADIREYPALDTVTKGTDIHVNSNHLVKVAVATATNGNGVLEYVCIKTNSSSIFVAIAATDGSRLHTIGVTHPDDTNTKEILVRNKLIALTAKAINAFKIKNALVRIATHTTKDSDNIDIVELQASSADVTIKTRHYGVAGWYPKYEQLIPVDQPYSLLVDKKLLLECIKQASKLSNKKTHVVELEIASRLLTMTGTTPDVGTSTGTCKINCAQAEDIPTEFLKIAFNHKFLTDAIKHHDGDLIEMQWSPPSSPCTFRDSTNKTMSLLMPVRIK